MKLFFLIKSENDCSLLQADLQRLVVWGEAIGLNLNISKCFVMNFSRLHSTINHIYLIYHISLKFSGDSVLDLGLIFRISHEFYLFFSLKTL